MRLRPPLFLLLLTLAAAALRFAALGRPVLWGDEALVYWRTCGTYADLLNILPADGFPPLHYELAWALFHAVGGVPSPALLRLVPALAGTLLVPAVYALARQLLPVRPSQFAATFATASAFALYYSRDAKMYAPAWTAETLAVAALLWWVRTGRGTAWLSWVAAAAVAAGFQTVTLAAAVGLSPLFLLTGQRPHWRKALAWLAGVVLIAAGPVGYYATFNTWTNKVEQSWQGSGLSWVAVYNGGRTGPQHARYLASTFLIGWEWSPPVRLPFRLPPVPLAGTTAARQNLLIAATVAAFAALLAGGLPWPRRWTATPDAGPEPPWRAALWLAAWIVLPTYAFYARSVDGFATPADWLAIPAHLHGWTIAAALSLATVVALLTLRPTRATTAAWLSAALAVAVVIAACELIGRIMTTAAAEAAAAGRPWHSVWVPRYLGFVWPAVAVAAGALLARVPTPVGRWTALAVVVLVNVALFAHRFAATTEPPIDRMAADVWSAQPRDGRPPDTLVLTDLPDHPDWQTGPAESTLYGDVGRYYLQRLADRQPMSPPLLKQSLSTFTLHNGKDVPNVLAAAPGVHHLILWQMFPVDAPAPADPDLPPGWRPTADDAVTVRNVWTARDVARYRRRVYDRP